MKKALRWLFVNQWDELRRGWYALACVLFWLAALCLLVGSILGLTYKLSQVGCRNQANEMHRPYKFYALGGCLVQLNDGTYVPINTYRAQQPTGPAGQEQP